MTWPSTGMRSPGRTTTRSPGRTVSIATSTTSPSRKHARRLGFELQQFADGIAGAALGARLEPAAEQDQRHHDGGGFEIGVVAAIGQQARQERATTENA